MQFDGKISLYIEQGCQVAYFLTKNPKMGTFRRVLQWKILVNFIAILYILLPFGIFCGHLVYFVAI
jgi:hypothetical protein